MKKLLTILAICLTSCVFGQQINGLEITTPMPISTDLLDHTGIKIHILSATAMDNGTVRVTFSTKLEDGTDCNPSVISEKVITLSNVEYDFTGAYTLLKQFLSENKIQAINK